MKKLLIYTYIIWGVTIMSSCSATKNPGLSNMVAIMQVDEPIPGVCNNSRVIAILPFSGNGQVEAQGPMTDEEIEEQLNASVNFLQNKPDYNDKGMVNLIINCEGEMVRCQIDNKTKSPELDEQIVSVFAKLKKWKAGTVNGEPVDTSVLYSFKIENGKIVL
ncbi:energy transducer TonB [Saccharicrinis sp. FJH62]|uniref:energy transducer TonB n=1 Tax=Saccharicrinis sp. FJH62 TaxID=3344657 RepID=UPI0035D4F3DA